MLVICTVLIPYMSSQKGEFIIVGYAQDYLCTVYAVHLANIKFGELECGGHIVWQIGLIKRNRLTIISVGGHKIWRLKPN